MLGGAENFFSTGCQNSLCALDHTQVVRKIALTYTSSDLVGKSLTNITELKQTEIYMVPLDYIRFNSTEVRNFISDDRSNNVFREAIVIKCPSDKFDFIV